MRAEWMKELGPLNDMDKKDRAMVAEIERLRQKLEGKLVQQQIAEDQAFVDRVLNLCGTEDPEEALRLIASWSERAFDRIQRRTGINVGHGHVWPRADGLKARCGGPGLCTECSGEAAAKANMQKEI